MFISNACASQNNGIGPLILSFLNVSHIPLLISCSNSIKKIVFSHAGLVNPSQQRGPHFKRFRENLARILSKHENIYIDTDKV